LRAALGGRAGANIEDFAQEALLKITNNLDSFRGESHFTTWAKNIAMNVALTERRRWRDVSLQELLAGHQGTGRGLADLQLTPEQVAFQNIVLAEVRGIIDKELTDRQREVVVAVILEGMPIAEVARRMGTNQNALYKLLHDARRKLGWDVGRVKNVRSAIPDATSLNRTLSSDQDSSELGDFIEDELEASIAGQVVRELETHRLMESVERVPERQRRVLVRRYGLDGKEPATLADLSEELGVSRERVRQLQREAEGVLRDAAGEHRLGFPTAA
jgi:RNA polymerase primary sigma factor